MFFHNSCPENSWNQLKKKNCFQFFVYGFIFSLKTWAYLKCKRVLYSSDRLVVFSNPSLSLKKEKVKDWIIVIG